MVSKGPLENKRLRATGLQALRDTVKKVAAENCTKALWISSSVGSQPVTNTLKKSEKE